MINRSGLKSTGKKRKIGLENITAKKRKASKIMAKSTFTFITHYKGGISTRQVNASGLKEACRKWAEDTLQLEDIPYIDATAFIHDFNASIDDTNPTPIDSSVNLWLMTFLTGGKTMWTHIVKTAA